MVALFLDESFAEKRADRLRFGVIGLGVGASSILPTLALSPFSELRAGADINRDVRTRVSTLYPDITVYDSAERICEDPNLDAIWISTPNKLHAEHAICAAKNGKHVIISKPMTTSMKEAEAINVATIRNNVKLVAGHSLGFSPAIRAMARLSQPHGRMGRLHVAQMMAFTDWMILPRTAEEVDSTQGGGLIHRQSPHQIDALRLLGGGLVRSVRANVGQWMPERNAPGVFVAFLEFEDGAVGIASHNGYGHLVTSEVVQWGSDIGISGNTVEQRAQVRQALRSGTIDEEAQKHAMRLGGTNPLFRVEKKRKPWLPLHLGLTVVSCQNGDMRHSPFGIYLYDDRGRDELEVADDGAWFGSSEIEELYQAVRTGAGLYRDGEWGMATLEVALAIAESARTRTEIKLKNQVPVRPEALAE